MGEKAAQCCRNALSQGQRFDPTVHSFPDKTGIREIARAKKPEFQLSFSFWEECG